MTLRERRTALQAGAAGLAALVAAALLLLAPGPGVAVLAGVAALTGLLAAALPSGLLPTAALLLLVTEDVAVTADRSAALRVVATVVPAAALWLLHSTYALVAVVPRGAEVDGEVVRRWVRRQRDVLAVALPLALVCGLAALVVPDSGWLPWLGVAAAAVLVTRP